MKLTPGPTIFNSRFWCDPTFEWSPWTPTSATTSTSGYCSTLQTLTITSTGSTGNSTRLRSTRRKSSCLDIFHLDRSRVWVSIFFDLGFILPTKKSGKFPEFLIFMKSHLFSTQNSSEIGKLLTYQFSRRVQIYASPVFWVPISWGKVLGVLRPLPNR